jgi:hypothetical protein
MSRRIISLVICGVVAFLALVFLPGSAVDRAAFFTTARSFANPPFFITGNGDHSRPYTLRTLRNFSQDTPPKLPTVISIGDDPDGFFQSSPPSPVDFAIILSNLKRLGEENPAIAFPLAWDEPDVISLAALDLQLDSLPGVVTTAPLSRNTVSSAMPPAFRRASIPISQIKGDVSQLPRVNRVSLPDVILGNNSSLAGFSAIESEPPGKTPFLIARWDDTIVFSFHLVTALRHFEAAPSALEIVPGKYISFSKNGPYIPIDKQGRLAFAPPVISVKEGIPAPDLIDAPDDFLTEVGDQPLVLRNDLSAADASTEDFSTMLTGMLATMTNPAFTSATRTFHRIPGHIETLLVLAFVVLLVGLCYHSPEGAKIQALAAAGAIIALHFILVNATGTWLPTLPLLAASIAYGSFATILPFVEKEKIASAPPKVPALVTPAKPAVKKTATKKPAKKAVKKIAKKATTKPAKKAVKKAAKKTMKKAAKKTARKTPAKKTPSKSSER